MEKASRVIFKTMKSFMTLASCMIFVGVILATINATLRKLDYSLSWAEEATQYLIMLGFYIGTPYVMMKNRQLRIGLLDPFLKSRPLANKAVYIGYGILEIVIFSVLARYCLSSIQPLYVSGYRLNHIPIQKFWLYVIVEITYILTVISWVGIILRKGEKFDG